MGTASSNCSALTANWKDTPPPQINLVQIPSWFLFKLLHYNESHIDASVFFALLLFNSRLKSCQAGSVSLLQRWTVCETHYVSNLRSKLAYSKRISVWRYILRIKCMAVLFIIPSLDCAMCSFGRPQGLISIHCYPMVYKVRRWSGLLFISLFKKLLCLSTNSFCKLFQVYKGGVLHLVCLSGDMS